VNVWTHPKVFRFAVCGKNVEKKYVIKIVGISYRPVSAMPRRFSRALKLGMHQSLALTLTVVIFRLTRVDG